MVNDNLKRLSTPELWRRLGEALVATARGIMQTAEIWVELQERGEDLSGHRNPLFEFLPDIAKGKLLPEMILKYGGSPQFLRTVRELVVEDQRKILKPGATVPVLSAEGKAENRRPQDLTMAEARMVFGDGHIRSPREQKKFLPAPVTLRSWSTVPSIDVIRSDTFDLGKLLTQAQRDAIVKRATRAKQTPAEYLVHFLIQRKVIPAAEAVAARQRAA